MIARTQAFALTLLTLLVFAGCGGSTEEPAESPAPTGEAPVAETAPAPTEPQIEDGVQVVHVTTGPAGYEPQLIALQAGMPARLVFTRTVDSECLEQVQIPDVGIERTDLPLNEPVAIEFTPEQEGEFTFVCGMDMQTGTLLVRRV